MIPAKMLSNSLSTLNKILNQQTYDEGSLINGSDWTKIKNYLLTDISTTYHFNIKIFYLKSIFRTF